MKRRVFVKFAMSLLACGLCSGVALAEEMGKVTEREECSLLGDFLGAEDLREAILENGMESLLSVSCMEGMAEAFAPGRMYAFLEESAVNLGITWDPVRKYWNLHVSGDMYGDTQVAADLYGDTKKLMLSCVPFYDGALGIEEGSVAEQYAGSGLEDLVVDWLEGPACSELPDFQLEFYPEKSFAEEQGMLERLQVKLERKVDQLIGHMAVDREETDGAEVFRVTVETADVLEIGQVFFSQFLALAVDSGLMDYYEALDIVYDFMYYIEETEAKLSDSIKIEAVKEQGELTGVSIFLNVMDRRYRRDSEGELIFETEETGVYCDVDLQTTRTDTTDIMIVSLALRTDYDLLFRIDPFVMEFDAVTGNLNATAFLSDRWGEMVTVALESAVADVVRGESFAWEIDELSVAAGGEKVGLKGELSVSAGVRDFERPKNALMIGDASRGELFSVISDVMINAERWMYEIEEMAEKAALF